VGKKFLQVHSQAWALGTDGPNHLVALYPGQPGWASTRNVNPMCHPQCPQILSLSTLTLRPPIIPLCSNTRENPRTRVKKNVKNTRTSTCTSFRLILDFMRPLVYRWSTLAVWPLAGLQQPHRWEWEYAQPCNPAYFYDECPCCRNPPYFQVRGLAENMLACMLWG